MFPWRVIVSFLFGCAALWCAYAFGQMLHSYPDAAMVMMFAALLALLACMSFAQDDGRIRRR